MAQDVAGSIFGGARWIWSGDGADRPNQYVCLRREFDAGDADPSARMLVSADSDFMLWVNGVEAGRGQFPDYPLDKTYSELPVGALLRKGRNVVAVLAYYCGENFSTYRKGSPGFVAALLNGGGAHAETDASWKCLPHPAFKSGMAPKVSSQLGFTVSYDARLSPGDWTNPDFDDSGWPSAVVRPDEGRVLSPRPVPPLVIGGRVPVSLTIQGELRRSRELDTPAMTSYSDMLRAMRRTEAFKPESIQMENPGSDVGPVLLGGGSAARPEFAPLSGPDSNGRYVVCDLGKIFVGLVELSVRAPAGTVLDISHGEHLDDGRVRCHVGGRNFTDRFVCAEGLNKFAFPFRRVGCRYLEVHFTSLGEGPVALDYIGLRPVSCPSISGDVFFECGDRLLERLHSVSVRTLEMCMHDHYEDCPWREQALYSYDSRNQALYGYYLWGNYDFAAASIDLLGKGLRGDGLLELCAPAKCCATIPIFSFVWIAELREHFLHGGDIGLFRRNAGAARRIIGTACERPDQLSGIFRMPEDSQLWHFYEWSEGMSGAGLGLSRKDEVHSAYNIYLLEAMRAFAALLRASGELGEAEEMDGRASNLAAAVDKTFWDPSKSAYASRIADGLLEGAHEHVQAIALFNGLPDAEKRAAILGNIYSRRLVPVTFSAMPYLLRAMAELGPDARSFMSRVVSESFEPIALSGSSTLWETSRGGDDFSAAGSLCHGWSSLPAYYLRRHVLGVSPLEPGFKKFKISPYADRLRSARGRVPTPHGAISVEWTRDGESGIVFSAEGPPCLEPVLDPLPECPVLSAKYNSRALL